MPKGQVVVAGTSTTLLCEAASTSSLAITWTKDGQELELSIPVETENGISRRNLVFSNLSASDSGNYTCNVRSDFQMRTLNATGFLDVFSESISMSLHYAELLCPSHQLLLLL